MGISITYDSLPVDDNDGDHVEASASADEGTGMRGDGEQVKWEIVAETFGLLQAQIIAGRLQTEGIPARAWQESVGQVYGMTVGPMGTGFVSVPDNFVERVQEMLAEDLTVYEDDDEE